MKTNFDFLVLSRSILRLALAGAVACTGFLSCTKTPGGPGHDSGNGKIIYVESNDYHDNKNAILAYRQKQDGTIEALPGSPFWTSGAGIGNPMQILGPDDSDNPIIITSDGQFLLAVNAGSNTIAVFSINRDGSLTAVPGSPFSSGGATPVSLSVSDRYVYVVNKSQDPLHPTTLNPNYNVLTINGNGWLVSVPGAKFETVAGASPSQALVSKNHRFLFGADFLAFQVQSKNPTGTLRSFDLEGSGRLHPVPGTPQVIPAKGGALGLWEHPEKSVLYVGFPLAGAVGVYSVDQSSGALTFKSQIAAQAAACWIRTNKEGDRLYVLNSAENTVGVYNSSNELSPSLINNFTLKNPGPLYAGPGGAMFTTSQDFSLGFSPSGKYLYVVSQHTNTDFTIGSYNFLHVLEVAADGTLSEPHDAVQLPVTADIRPQGVAVF